MMFKIAVILFHLFAAFRTFALPPPAVGVFPVQFGPEFCAGDGRLIEKHQLYLSAVVFLYRNSENSSIKRPVHTDGQSAAALLC